MPYSEIRSTCCRSSFSWAHLKLSNQYSFSTEQVQQMIFKCYEQLPPGRPRKATWNHEAGKLEKDLSRRRQLLQLLMHTLSKALHSTQGPPQSEILKYLSLHFSSTLAVLPNLIVQHSLQHILTSLASLNLKFNLQVWPPGVQSQNRNRKVQACGC